MHKAFSYSSLDELSNKIKEGKYSITLSEDVSILSSPLIYNSKNNKTINNRLAILPMEGCDGKADGSPDYYTKRRYERFSKSGAGLIWFEAVAVSHEGRANPRQLFMHSKNVDDFKILINEIKENAIKHMGFEPLIIMQGTHSGRYSKPDGKPAPIIACNNPFLEDEKIAKENIVSDDYLKRLEHSFGELAKLSENAGFDGIDIKSCHGYLISELLSAYTREGEYGGSFENRTKLLINSLKSAISSVSSDFITTTRLNLHDRFPYPFGFGMKTDGSYDADMAEPLRLISILHNELNINMLNLTMGNPYRNPHVNRPYDKGAYVPDEHPFAGIERMFKLTGEVQKSFKDLIVISSAASYFRQFSHNLAAGAINEGLCQIAGFGRQAFAYPNFADDIINKGGLDSNKCCITCGKCTELMRSGNVSGCVIRDKDVYGKIYKENVLKS